MGRRGRRGRADSWRRESSSSRGNPGFSRWAWIPTVPAWEKKFCMDICGIPWEKILEAKETLRIFPEVAEWDDSAAKEALDSAKAEYYAKINGNPCHVSSPSPDAFIDEIDWAAEIDQELILELDPLKDQVREIKGDEKDEDIPRTGWDDPDDDDDDNCIIDPWERAARQMDREREWRLDDCFLKAVDNTCQAEEEKNFGR